MPNRRAICVVSNCCVSRNCMSLGLSASWVYFRSPVSTFTSSTLRLKLSLTFSATSSFNGFAVLMMPVGCVPSEKYLDL